MKRSFSLCRFKSICCKYAKSLTAITLSLVTVASLFASAQFAFAAGEGDLKDTQPDKVRKHF